MTKSREHKAKIQQTATSTEPVRSVSPRQVAKYGRFLPTEVGRKFETSCVRENRTHGRTREVVVENKVKARRGAGMIKKLIG
jgi:hypothetical protein